MLSQWLGLALFVIIIAGLVFAFIRKGLTIKPDPDHKPPSHLGGQPMD
jgi:uncharacterized membrane protein YagU involved in acid resistance